MTKVYHLIYYTFIADCRMGDQLVSFFEGK